MSSTPLEWPCAVSTTIRSTPSSIRAMARFQESPKKPTAAPTRSRPWSSFDASGYWSDLTKSFKVISPRSRPWSSTSGNFSILFCASRRIAASALIPTGPVTSGIGVITAPTSRDGSLSNRMSRLVTMPSRRMSRSTTGTPEIR